MGQWAPFFDGLYTVKGLLGPDAIEGSAGEHIMNTVLQCTFAKEALAEFKKLYEEMQEKQGAGGRGQKGRGKGAGGRGSKGKGGGGSSTATIGDAIDVGWQTQGRGKKNKKKNKKGKGGKGGSSSGKGGGKY